MHDEIVITGGGPAGMMAGVLMARAGLSVTVIEKHGDFFRDFRGDTVHPSTLELMDELGWLAEFLELPYSRVDRISGRVAGRMMNVADFRLLPVRAPFIAMMPQWDFLNFLAKKGSRYSGFKLRMGTEVTNLVHDDRGRVSGVELAGGEQVLGRLTIAADGRHSVLRTQAALPLEILGVPIDVFWFCVPKSLDQKNDTFGIFESGRIMVLIDRGDYWQCAFVIGKGQAANIRNAGLSAFKEKLLQIEPRLAPGLENISNFDDVKLLSVAVDRLKSWHRPGLLVIGDAAHAMSPIGGVGINLAVQDGVAAANILAGPMMNGEDSDPLLAKVQSRRMRPTKIIQAVQKTAQNNLIFPLVSGKTKLFRPPIALRLLNAMPILQRMAAHIIGLGFGREHISSPNAWK